MHWNRIVFAGIVAAITLVTLAGALAWNPWQTNQYQLGIGNPHPVQTAQYRAFSPYTTPYMATGFSPLGTSVGAYAPSYGWASQYTARLVRPYPMDSFGPRVTAPYNNDLAFARRVDENRARGMYDPWTGMYVNQGNTLFGGRTFQYQYQPAATRFSVPPARYPNPSVVQGAWW